MFVNSDLFDNGRYKMNKDRRIYIDIKYMIRMGTLVNNLRQ